MPIPAETEPTPIPTKRDTIKAAVKSAPKRYPNLLMWVASTALMVGSFVVVTQDVRVATAMLFAWCGGSTVTYIVSKAK